MKICPACGQTIRTKDVERGRLGNLVHAERLARGWTLRQAEEEWGITFTALSRIERGTVPSAPYLVKLIAALGLTPTEVTGLFEP